MREYPKQIRRLSREYAARAYEAEPGQTLGELEAEFACWRSGPKTLRAGSCPGAPGKRRTVGRARRLPGTAVERFPGNVFRPRMDSR